MTVRNVNGGSIPNAIAASAPFDEINMGSNFTYPGFKCAKPLHFRGDNVVIEGPYPGQPLVDSLGNPLPLNTTDFTPTAAGGSLIGAITTRDSRQKQGSSLLVRANDFKVDIETVEESEKGFGLRVYQADRVDIHIGTIRKVAFGGQVREKGLNAKIVVDNFIDIDRMMVNDPAPGSDTGATAFDFFRCTGPVLLQIHTVRHARSKDVSYDYRRDGGLISAWGGARNVTVEMLPGGGIWDVLNVFEDGKAAGDADNANFVLRGLEVYGSPTLGTSKDDYVQGLLIRAMQNMLIENCKFIDLDGFGTFLFSKDGNYQGGLGGIVARNNLIQQKLGTLVYTFNTNVPLSAVTLANEVRSPSNVASIASVAGKGTTKDLATFRSWGAQAAGETWGPIVPAETELQKAIRERDEARAERDEAQADVVSVTTMLNEALEQKAIATTQRDAYDSIIERSKVSNAATQDILNEKT
jgi:hypothetical protein